MLKRCTRCNKEKDISEFGKNRLMNDGYDYYCKECKKLFHKKYYNSKKFKESLKKLPKKICIVCKKEYHSKNKNSKYCSRKCYAKALSISFRGGNNPFYKRKHRIETRVKMSKSAKIRQLEGRGNPPPKDPTKYPNWQKNIQRKDMKPSKIELKFIEIINIYNLPITYVGDYYMWIARKNPDFRINNQRKLIELLGGIGYYHKKEDAKILKKHYEKNNWECLFIFEEDLKLSNLKNLLLKVANYINSKELYNEAKKVVYKKKARKKIKLVKNIKCFYCGKFFHRPPSLINKTNNYCSRACADLARRKRIIVTCQYCGIQFETLECNQKLGRSYHCSKKCRAQHSYKMYGQSLFKESSKKRIRHI